jgi:hypothetical protein
MRRLCGNFGSILKKICYLSKPKDWSTNLAGEKIEVSDTFPYNPESKTSPSTAMQWAKGYHYYYAAKDGTPPPPDPVPIELDNVPFEVTIIDLLVRSEGGRAYKVVDRENRLFDMREDQLVEAITFCGVSPGGKIPGKFVWATVASTTRMVLVGGKLHDSIVRSQEEKENIKTKSVKASKSLRLNGVYKKKDSTFIAYLGRVRDPDNKKLLYAFIELPQTPKDQTAVLKDYLDEKMRLYYEAVQSAHNEWDNWSWQDRFYWDEVTSRSNSGYQRGYFHSITLVSSPFEDLVDTESDIEDDLASHLRINADGKRLYQDGWGTELLVARRKRDWWNQSEDERASVRNEYQKKLIWSV